MSGPGTGFDEVADGVWVHHQARLDCEVFTAGRGTIVNAHARVFGSEVRLGRECWLDEHATIGGGSAHDPGAFLRAGDWLHLGNYSQVNIARGVVCGDEVGLGIGTRVFTHGAYLSEWDGFPVAFEGVQIGSRVWLPNAQVNPGVRIGDDVVVAAGSVVTRDVPTGVLAAGTPAAVVRPLSPGSRQPAEHRRRVLATLATEIEARAGTPVDADPVAGRLTVAGATFDLDDRTVAGEVTTASETARNQLRRRGIRFRYEPVDGGYRPWA
ncbi:MAG TPA: acyltransferase [Acidimicrobiales bacterium]|nr:acyltransferase [Acidimicrobiales bacterium]